MIFYVVRVMFDYEGSETVEFKEYKNALAFYQKEVDSDCFGDEIRLEEGHFRDEDPEPTIFENAFKIFRKKRKDEKEIIM